MNRPLRIILISWYLFPAVCVCLFQSQNVMAQGNDGGFVETTGSSEKSLADDLSGVAGAVWKDMKKDAARNSAWRVNDLPGNSGDVQKRNVFHAPSKEIWEERKKVKQKLSKLDSIEKNTYSLGGFVNSDKFAAIKENRARLTKRLDLLNKERARRIAAGKWQGFVPPGDEDAPPPPPPPAEGKWGGPLPEVKKTNPTTMGRSGIEVEMKQLNRDREDLRKRLDHMNKLGALAGSVGTVGRKPQVEALLKEVVARLSALEAEKKHQIKQGTWGYSSQDISRTKATPKQIAEARAAGKELAEQLKNGWLSSAEVRQATRDAYGRYQNNEKLKEAFKEGYRIGSQ